MNKYVSNFTIRLNAITTTGALYAVQASEAAVAKAKGQNAEVVSCTPDGKPVVQVYVPKDDPAGGTVLYKNQLEKATKNPETDELVMIGKDNLEAAKESLLPKNVLNLTVHEPDELDGQNWHSNHKAYVFFPDMKDDANVQWYNLLRELVAESGKAFCGQAVIKVSNEAFYRLRIWRNNIVIERQVPPEEINEIPEGHEGSIKDTTFQKAVTAVEKMVEPFDPDKYANKAAAAVAALNELAVTEGVDVDTVSVAPAAAEAFDIDTALDGFGDF
jgi:non-homologous end joining protein Ku